MPMSREVSRSSGRLILFLVMTFGFLSSLGVLWFRGEGGAISWSLLLDAGNQLLAIYAPSLAIMTAFYFAGRRGAVAGTVNCPLRTLVAAVVFIGLFAFLPT